MFTRRGATCLLSTLRTHFTRTKLSDSLNNLWCYVSAIEFVFSVTPYLTFSFIFHVNLVQSLFPPNAYLFIRNKDASFGRNCIYNPFQNTSNNLNMEIILEQTSLLLKQV